MDLKSSIIGGGTALAGSAFAYGFYAWAQNQPNPDRYMPLEIIFAAAGGLAVLIGARAALKGSYASQRNSSPLARTEEQAPQNRRPVKRFDEVEEEIIDQYGRRIKRKVRKYREH